MLKHQNRLSFKLKAVIQMSLAKVQTLDEKENWKPIKGYEGYYNVSNYGNVESLKNSLILKPYLNNNGYLTLSLCVGNKTKTKLIHRLVAKAFVENPKLLNVVNHLDCDKTNNYYKNLEWGTSKHNSEHMVKMGRSLKGSLNTKAKLNESQAEEIRALRNKGAGTIELCEKYNVCASTIRYIIANVRYSDNQYKPQIKKNKERISKETVDKIFEMYKNGSKISEISQSLSIDRSTISKWVNGRNSLKL